MLSGLLEKHQCADCRYCCVFDRLDFWEMPSLLEPTAKAILNMNADVSLNRQGSVYTFDDKNLTEELYPCPALTDKGCGLPSELKPFECSIWPFRVMEYCGDMVLAVCTDCESLKDVSVQVVDNFANSKVRAVAFDYAKKYPQMVKPYHGNYRIVPCE